MKRKLDEELLQLIHDLRVKFGTEETAKRKQSLINIELLKRIQALDERYPVKYSRGRPKKGEER